MSRNLKVVSRGKLRPLNPVQKKQVKNILLGQVDVKQNIGTINTTTSIVPTFSAFANVGQGDTSLLRQGDQIIPMSIDGWLEFVAGDATNTCRFIIFQFLLDNLASTPSQSEMLAYASYPSLAAANLLYRQKYHIVYDSGVLAVSANDENGVRRIKVRAHKLRKIFFNGTLTSGKNILYVMHCSDSSAVTHPTVRAELRTVFKDP